MISLRLSLLIDDEYRSERGGAEWNAESEPGLDVLTIELLNYFN
jgi:hypothetical protein